MGVSRANAISLIERNQAKILGRKSQKSSILQDGDTIVVDQKESAERKEERNNKSSVCNIPIIYNDDDVVVIDKPVGVASHAAKGWSGPTVPECLEAAGIDIKTTLCDESRKGIVSRLDVGTSGLMIICKTDFAYEAMKNQFAKHIVKKNISCACSRRFSAR